MTEFDLKRRKVHLRLRVRSEALTYSDNVGVVAFLHTTQPAMAARTVLNAEYQLGVWGICQGKRKVKAQVEKHPGAALMVDLMQAFLAYWI